MRHISLILVTCLPLAACGVPEKSCSSDDIIKTVHSKLIEGMNFTIGVPDFYNGRRGKIELENPRYVGQNNDRTLCSVTMKRIHYVDPVTGTRYQVPKEETFSMPYNFKVIDALINSVQVAK